MLDDPGRFPGMEATSGTQFAPGGRARPEDLWELAQATLNNPIAQAVLESAEGFVMVLDEHRQILAANAELLDALGLIGSDLTLGPRPGEVLHCTHATEGPYGCGTSRACSQCGAVLTVLAAQTGHDRGDRECSLTCNRNGRLEASEFRVRATPLILGEHRLTILVLVDISAEKRRDVLESLFHHDVSNTLQGLFAWGDVLGEAAIDPKVAARKILEISLRLKQEIDNHRTLMAAEAGTFLANLERLEVQDILARLEGLFSQRPLARDRMLTFGAVEPDLAVRSDRALLMRILENMITNALEATPRGENVNIWFAPVDGHPGFHVRNPGVLPDSVALRVFQRSFSTKAAKGRGLGTYSMKLFGETYLGGQVSFVSRPEEGTTFSLLLST